MRIVAVALASLTWGCSGAANEVAPLDAGEADGGGTLFEAGSDAQVDSPDDAADGALPRDGGSSSFVGALGDVIGLSAGPVGCFGTVCDAQRAAFFQSVKSLGIRHIRTDVRWADLQAHRGDAMAFAPADRVVDAATASGVDVLGILDYSAPWANSHGDQCYPPDNFHDYVAYATAVVQRYQGRIRRYEIWNEPNAGFAFWKSSFGGDPANFGSLAMQTIAAIDALHLVNPPRIAPGGTVFLSQFVPVWPLGTIPSGPDFSRDAFAANPLLAKNIGAFAFHGYGQYPPRNAPESGALGEVQLGAKVSQTRAMLTAAGVHDRPLWLTEIGWPTANGVSEDTQARWLVRSVLLGGLLGVEAVYLYTLRDGANPAAWSFSPEASFGLEHADGSPKAAFGAMKTLIGTLGAFRVVGRNSTHQASDVYQIELVDPAGHRGWAAWRSDDSQPAIDLPLPAASVRGFAMDGAPLLLTHGSYAVSPDPVYLIER